MKQDRHPGVGQQSGIKGQRISNARWPLGTGRGSFRGARPTVLALLPLLVVCLEGYALSSPVLLEDNSGWASQPQVAADNAGSWVAVWGSDNSLGGTLGADGDIHVSYSSDKGSTWTVPAALNTNAATDSGGDFNPQIAYANGRWVAVWASTDSLEGTIGTDGDILVAYGTSSGGTWTWTTPVPLNAGADTDTVSDTDPHLAADGAGNWVCAWKRDTPDGSGNFDIVISAGTVAGTIWTWNTPSVLDTGLIRPDGDVTSLSVAGGGAGTWIVIWDPPVEYYVSATMFSRSTDNGATWSPRAPVDSTPGDSLYDWDLDVTTDGAGNWVATWIAHDVSYQGFVVTSRSVDDGATWSDPVGLAPGFGSARDTCVLSDRNGRWVALWTWYEDVYMSQSFDAGVSWSPQVLFSSLADYASAPQLATDGAGHWVGAWFSYDASFVPSVRAASFTSIRTLDELQAMQNDLSDDYVLGCDIDASATADWNGGAGFAPIGNSTSLFTGTFEGSGHEIRGLHINRPGESNVGLFGYARLATFKNVGLVNSTIAGGNTTGNLVGFGKSLTIQNCYAIGHITGAYNVGGIIGLCYGGTISECFTGGSVRSVNSGRGDFVGGITAYALRDYEIGTPFVIQRCYSTADTMIDSPAWSTEVAGLCGALQGGDAYDCYATGDAYVASGRMIAGLIGYASDGFNARVISRCYSTGRPSGGEDAYRGGLIGYNSSSHQVLNSYWDTQTSGMATSAGGTGLTTAQMQQQATFTGWDFSAVWSIQAGRYPELRALQFPSPRIEQAAGQADPVDALPIVFDVTFDEPVTGFEADDTDDVDVDFSGGTAPVSRYTVAAATDPPDGKSFKVTVTGVTNSGTFVARIPAGVCRDADGLPNDDSGSLDNSVTGTFVPPFADSILRSGGACRYVRSLSVDFSVAFDQPVTGVDPNDFSLVNAAVTNPSILSVTGIDDPTGDYHTTYKVTVNTGEGIGLVQLDLLDDDSITQQDGLPLGGLGAGNGGRTGDETYHIDKTALALGQEIPLPAGYTLADLNLAETEFPTDYVQRIAAEGEGEGESAGEGEGEVEHSGLFVIKKGAFTITWKTALGESFCQELATSVCVQSIRRDAPVLTHHREDQAIFRVQFTEAVTGVDVTDFSLANSGTESPSIAGISVVDAATYLVTVGTGDGRGVLALDAVDDNSIHDLLGNPLGGPGTDDGVYLEGQRYAIDKTVYKIGDAIPFPLEIEFFVQDDLILDASESLPTKKVNGVDVQNLFFIESAAATGSYSGLFAGDVVTPNLHPNGYTTITWTYDDGSPVLGVFDQEILVFPEAGHPPMRVYLTDSAQGATGAVKVDLRAADVVYIHHNTRIRPDYDPNPAMLGDEIKYMWVDSPIAQVKDLHARYYTGLAVLHFEDAGLNFVGVQTIEVRPYSTDYTMTCDLGYSPVPHDAAPEGYTAGPPSVTRGKSVDLNVSYVYQHEIADSSQYGSVYAVKKTTRTDQVEIFWMRLSEGTTPALQSLGIKWPYEMTRYTFDWPTDPAKYQRYVRGRSPNPIGVSVPIANSTEFYADVMPYTEFQSGFLVTKKPDANGAFETNGPGWALVRYMTGSPPGKDGVSFTTVRSVFHDDTAFFPNLALNEWPIGTEVTDPYHEPHSYHQYTREASGNLTKTAGIPGYLYVKPNSGENRYDWKAYDSNNGDGAVLSEDATGQIFPVNAGNFEVWWYNKDAQGTAWPSLVKRYQAKWPDTMADLSPWPNAATDKTIIASGLGTGIVPYNIWELYYQNDPARPGFNPNDEHAVVMSSVIYPLRDDLGTDATSLPYVLLRHRHPNTAELWQYTVYKVQEEGVDPRTDQNYTFNYAGTAGQLIQAPMPLSAMPVCVENRYISGPGWQDRNAYHWVRAAGDDGGPAQIVMQYFYPVNESFYWPQGLPYASYARGLGAHVPWLDMRPGGVSGTPINITFNVNWPDDVPTMKAGDTLVKAKLGLPAIAGRVSANILYQQATVLGHGSSVKLIDYKRTRPFDNGEGEGEPHEILIPIVPPTVDTQFMQGLTFFPQLGPALKPRVVYDAPSGKVGLRGFFVEPPLGDYYVFLNVMSEADKTELRALSTDANWTKAADDLYAATQTVIEVPPDSMDFEALALTAGFAQAGGYVTLAFENAEDAAPLPVSLEIIKVEEDFATGEIAAVYADCPFDERLVLMHKGDFNGHPEAYEFEWRTLPDTNGTPPNLPFEQWNEFTMVPADGTGARTITIGGPGIFTLSDNWFTCRYKKKSPDKAWPYDWSDWTQPQLAEGWIKRVVGQINPFTQRASGGGIEGAEVAFSSFADRQVNTVVSMISQAGPRWGGDVPMNCLNLDDYGLIEIYETVFGRGMELSIDATPSVRDYEPANKALLLVAGRVADLYMLLGNEAYADAADPTIAYGTEDGTYGAESTSIHCFMNMTSSLIEEELNLLRGRDNALMPPVSTPPVYNRLVWNFTGDINGGEVAYALNYNIQDQNGNVDGTISEADAKSLYPQGHGDAWGHYLTAIMRYYTLLRHENYLWVPRAEAVMVGGVPVTVDYLDERKFAKAAAARAHAGAEIASLTYRSKYTEDPAGQWQGYKDTDPERAWGVSDWASRAGMGAYFDWVVGNAILPSVDTNPEHVGIQKIDRTTVAELREVVNAYGRIESEMIKSDTGLNPLGLAKDVVPFDLDPTGYSDTSTGVTHFEQIYNRAVSALDNAVFVFNNANNCTQLLRRQADSTTDFQKTVTDQEADFNNRLIEVFGYPYSDDIGSTGTYPTGYNGPDIYHFDVVEKSDLLGEYTGTTQPFTVLISETYTTASGEMRNPAAIPEGNRTPEDIAHVKQVEFHLSKQGYGIVKDPDWTGRRRAPGEIQLAHSDLLQAIGTFKQGRAEYENLRLQMGEQLHIIADKYNMYAADMSIRGAKIGAHIVLNTLILASQISSTVFKRIEKECDGTADIIAESMPKIVGGVAGLACGTTVDVASIPRGAAKTVGKIGGTAAGIAGDISDCFKTAEELAKDIADLGFDMGLASIDRLAAWDAEKHVLQGLIRDEAVKQVELYTLAEAMRQAEGRYLAALASGARLLDDRLRFRQQTAAQVQDYRYKDMAFRVFRNDALQKYQSQFDLAARYVYLTAKAYDYETNLLGGDSMAGQQFLSDIVRARALGVFREDGQPMTGGDVPSLSDSMARMWQNFDLVLRGRLGFNNPQVETNRFSLRRELFRTADNPDIEQDDELWRETLRAHVVENILGMPEFQRYCSAFNPHMAEEPGIVIPFATSVDFGTNFFGWPLAGGDSSYDSSHFATKIRSAGVWFSNYNAASGGGMSNTPRVYLIPVGEDIMRSPSGDGTAIRKWTILDQKLPVPFPIGSGDMNNANWIPQIDTLQEIFADIRKFPMFRAYHDSGEFDPSEAVCETRLVGRSVWNTRWMLIIPAGTLSSDRQEAIAQFIYGPETGGVRTGEGVSDILIYFQTYAYAGGKKKSAHTAEHTPETAGAPVTAALAAPVLER